MAVEQLDHARWAEQQPMNPNCKAAVLYVRLRRPVQFPTDILRKVGSCPSPTQDEVLSLTDEGDLSEVPLTTRCVAYLLVRKTITTETFASVGFFIPMTIQLWVL